MNMHNISSPIGSLIDSEIFQYFIDGSANSHFWNYAIGKFNNNHNGRLITRPGFMVSQVHLWIRSRCLMRIFTQTFYVIIFPQLFLL